MRLYLFFTKRILAAITAAFCLLIFIWGRFAAAKNIYKNGDTNSKRVYYIDTLGYEVDEVSVCVKKIKITEEVSVKYGVKGYTGCESRLYQYDTADKENQIDLVIYNGRIIGVGVTPSGYNEQGTA